MPKTLIIRGETVGSTARDGENAAPKPHSLRVVGLLGRTIYIALLALLALAAVPYGSVELWWQAVFECAAFALAGLWLIEGLLTGSWRTGGGRLLPPLLALILFAFIQTLPLYAMDTQVAGVDTNLNHAISADPYSTQLFTLKLSALLLTGLLLIRYTSTRKRLHALIITVIGIGAASALFGIVRQTAQRNAPDFILPFLTPGTGYGQFINSNHFAFMAEMALGLTLGMIVGGGVRHDRLLVYLGAALPLWAALVLSGSRGGVLGLLSQLLFLVILFNAARPEASGAQKGQGLQELLRRWLSSLALRVILIICLPVLVGLSVIWVGGEPIVSSFESVASDFSEEGEQNRVYTSRAGMWRMTLQMIRDHSTVGVGFGAYWMAVTPYHDASGKFTPQEAHNDYLELAASGGVVGLLLATWFIATFISRAYNILRSQDTFRRATCLGALTGIFGVAVHSLVDFGLHITINALVFTALLVIATVEIQRE